MTVELDVEMRRRLVALTRCASADRMRPVLACVHFTATQAQATDSYVLGMVGITGGPKKSRMVGAKDLAAALRGVNPKAVCLLEFGDDGATVTVESPTLLRQTMTVTTVLPYAEGKFPDVAQILPKELPELGAGYDPAPVDVVKLAKVAALAPKGSAVRLRFQPRTNAGGARPFVVESEDGMLGLVMPHRDWAAREREQAA